MATKTLTDMLIEEQEKKMTKEQFNSILDVLESATFKNQYGLQSFSPETNPLNRAKSTYLNDVKRELQTSFTGEDVARALMSPEMIKTLSYGDEADVANDDNKALNDYVYRMTYGRKK